MAQQRKGAPSAGGGKQQQQQHHYHGRPKKPKKSRSSHACWFVLGGVVMVAAALLFAVRWYRENYPTEQRCPPESDRFHDHCKEGRKHYVLKLDWDCLGSRRAEAMRMALALPNDGKPLRGVGEVPSWLTDANAKILADPKAPCMKGVVVDKACRYCKPTPKPKQPSSDATTAAAAGAEAAGSAGEPAATAQASAAAEDASTGDKS